MIELSPLPISFVKFSPEFLCLRRGYVLKFISKSLIGRKVDNLSVSSGQEQF